MFKLALAALSFLTLVSPRAITTQGTQAGGYIQNPSGSASFTWYDDCSQPACGRLASGYSAAVSQLAYGAPPGLGPGDACGRCFRITANKDPYTPEYQGPFKTIVVKVIDLCPIQGNGEFCGNTRSHPKNSHGASMHFDICTDTGGAKAFFPPGHGALMGNYTEVPCNQWSGRDGNSIWEGSCLAGEKASNWPSTGCGNQGSAP